MRVGGVLGFAGGDREDIFIDLGRPNCKTLQQRYNGCRGQVVKLNWSLQWLVCCIFPVQQITLMLLHNKLQITQFPISCRSSRLGKNDTKTFLAPKWFVNHPNSVIFYLNIQNPIHCAFRPAVLITQTAACAGYTLIALKLLFTCTA